MIDHAPIDLRTLPMHYTAARSCGLSVPGHFATPFMLVELTS
jgi:hypothetical protein